MLVKTKELEPSIGENWIFRFFLRKMTTGIKKLAFSQFAPWDNSFLSEFDTTTAGQNKFGI